MSKISRLKSFLVLVLTLALSASSGAQTQLSYPDVNPRNSVPAECLRDPSLPSCNDLLQRQNAPSTRSTEPGPLQNAQRRERDGESRQEEPPTRRSAEHQKEASTEFQLFVNTSLGQELPLFGYSLFEQSPSTFAPIDRMPVTAEYVIGPGDELLIRAWGQIDLDAKVIVDRAGAIYLPRVGSIAVAGIQYRQLSDFLKSSVGRIFRNFDLTVTLGQLRSIQVLVVGQTRSPGVYTVSSLSTLINALFASGGPSNSGSMRHIQLKRNGMTITDFDLYDLLLKGDKSKDAVLQPGDVIYIPTVGPQVAVAGSVSSPAIYELAAKTTLGQQIDIAGGLSKMADGERAIVEHIDDRKQRTVDEFTLDTTGLGRELKDGDVVRVFSISPRIVNAITLRGNVAQPGRYPWREGMHIRDLIPNREFLLTREFWEQQNAITEDKTFGSNPVALNSAKSSLNNVEPRNESDRQTRERTTVGEGFTTPALKTEALKNDVKRNAPEINWEYAVIQRLDPAKLTTSLLSFNLGKAILEGNDAENKLLQAGDIVTIFSQRDMSVSLEKQSKFIRLEGEFRSPGIYKVEPGETLRDVVIRSGGLTDLAYLYGSQFTRESVKKEQQHSLDEMARSLELEIQRKTMYTAQSHPEQQGNILTQSQADQAFVDKLRAVTASGRVVLELDPSQTSVEELPQLALEDGDCFIVPFKSSTVSVVGAVYNQTSFTFKAGMPIKIYLKLAGNGTRNADNKHMFLLRADGSVVSREQISGVWSDGFNSIRALPGDMLVVPTQLDKGAFLRGLKDWSQVISQFGLGAAAVYVLTK